MTQRELITKIKQAGKHFHKLEAIAEKRGLEVRVKKTQSLFGGHTTKVEVWRKT